MAILNETELRAANESLFQTGVVGGITAAKMREWNVDVIESERSYRVVLAGEEVNGINITDAGAVWDHYNASPLSANALLTPDFLTGKISVLEPANYFATIRFNGKWPANEDLNFTLTVNGVGNALTPVSFTKEGKGTNDPELISVTDIDFTVDSGMLAAGIGGAAIVELFVSSLTGPFILDQATVSLSLRYNTLSIRTVG